MGEMSVMGKEGDTKTIWDPSNFEETEAARQLFEELVKKAGFVAFEVDSKGNKKAKKRVDEFDPDLGKMIMVPPMAGG